jgi:hypothetical protein
MPIQSVRIQTIHSCPSAHSPLGYEAAYSQLDIAAALKLLSSVGAFPIFLSGVNNPVVILRSACGIDLLDRVDSPVFCLV